MKTTKITKAQAITIIKNILIEGCDIPQASSETAAQVAVTFSQTQDITNMMSLYRGSRA